MEIWEIFNECTYSLKAAWHKQLLAQQWLFYQQLIQPVEGQSVSQLLQDWEEPEP